MAEIVVTPSGPGALEAGLMLDEHGTRYVVLTFKEPEGDPVIVTFEVPLFQSYVEVLQRTAAAAGDERNWVVG
jgi:hypothetical protein